MAKSRNKRGKYNPKRGRNNQKGRKRNNQKKRSGFVPKFQDGPDVFVAGTYGGVLEVNDKGYGFIRKIDHEFTYHPTDPFIKPDHVRKQDLKSGLVLEGEFEEDAHGNRRVHSIDRINQRPADEWQKVVRFERQIPEMPTESLTLGANPEETELRALDLIAPIGKGQRALIVAPPRTGKTVLLKQIAGALTEHHPEVHTSILLVDERPEEVTDFLRTTSAEVFASSNDRSTQSHVRIAEMALGYAKRKAESGQDAVLLIDSLTRMSRAYNAAQTGSGRTLSGGLDIRALEVPKRIFGSARAFEGGGSLTIIATCLIETNSRMDDLIFEEFKGTGNMELVLDREVANDRIFPSINILSSGTRNEDKFITDSMDERNAIRRYLLKKSPKDAMLQLLKVIKNTDSNEELFMQLQ